MERHKTYTEFACSQCGYKWIGASSTCPQCKGIGKADGSDFTKKTNDEPDLIKGLR